MKRERGRRGGRKKLPQEQPCSHPYLKFSIRAHPSTVSQPHRKPTVTKGEENTGLQACEAETEWKPQLQCRKAREKRLRESKAGGAEDRCLCFLTPPWAASRQTDTTENHGIQYRQSWNGSGLTSSGSCAQGQNTVQLFHYHESCFEFSIPQCACP